MSPTPFQLFVRSPNPFPTQPHRAGFYPTGQRNELRSRPFVPSGILIKVRVDQGFHHPGFHTLVSTLHQRVLLGTAMTESRRMQIEIPVVNHASYAEEVTLEGRGSSACRTTRRAVPP